MAYILQFRRDTAARWASKSTILLSGELGLETDTKFFKIGDGLTSWNSLGYAQEGPRGPRGYDFQYSWDGTRLGVKSSNDAAYTFVDLKGDKGDQGDRGFDFQYVWDGTRLGVKQSDEAEFNFTDLKGETGDKGDAATIAVGSITPVPFGAPPTVTNAGTPAAAVFNFELMTGEKGDKGDKGDQGERGFTGSVAGSFGVSIDGAGSVITPGIKQHLIMPFTCVITGWHIVGSPAGHVVIDLWKANGALPSVLNSITGTEKPTISGASMGSNPAVSTWAVNVAAGDIIAFIVESCLVFQKLTLAVAVTK